jgi:hypothetical protein
MFSGLEFAQEETKRIQAQEETKRAQEETKRAQDQEETKRIQAQEAEVTKRLQAQEETKRATHSHKSFVRHAWDGNFKESVEDLLVNHTLEVSVFCSGVYFNIFVPFRHKRYATGLVLCLQAL